MAPKVETQSGDHYSVSQLVSYKNEDRFAAWEEMNLECPLGSTSRLYAVFDGHGGAGAATLCAERLGDAVGEALVTVQQLKPSNFGQQLLLEDSALTNSLYDLDGDVREHVQTRDISGTTVAAALVRSFDDGSHHIKICWIGDSRILVIDGGSGKSRWISPEHKASNPDEYNRIAQFDPTVKAGTKNLQTEMEKSVHVITVDAESDDSPRVSSNIKANGMVGRTAMTSEIAPTPLSPEEMQMAARATFVARARSTSGEAQGPLRVYAKAGAAGIVVTRTMGDPDRARSVIPTPDFYNYKLGPNEGGRVVIASDGFWDVFDDKKACNLIKSIKEDAQAAQFMANKAKERRLYLGLGPDDITVMVLSVGELSIAPAGCSCTVQ